MLHMQMTSSMRSTLIICLGGCAESTMLSRMVIDSSFLYELFAVKNLFSALKPQHFLSTPQTPHAHTPVTAVDCQG
jgi:hypothetical protein